MHRTVGALLPVSLLVMLLCAKGRYDGRSMV